jgi:hypothetical protein
MRFRCAAVIHLASALVAEKQSRKRVRLAAIARAARRPEQLLDGFKGLPVDYFRVRIVEYLPLGFVTVLELFGLELGLTVRKLTVLPQFRA